MASNSKILKSSYNCGKIFMVTFALYNLYVLWKLVYVWKPAADEHEELLPLVRSINRNEQSNPIIDISTLTNTETSCPENYTS